MDYKDLENDSIFNIIYSRIKIKIIIWFRSNSMLQFMILLRPDYNDIDDKTSEFINNKNI